MSSVAIARLVTKVTVMGYVQRCMSTRWATTPPSRRTGLLSLSVRLRSTVPSMTRTSRLVFSALNGGLAKDFTVTALFLNLTLGADIAVSAIDGSVSVAVGGTFLITGAPVLVSSSSVLGRQRQPHLSSQRLQTHERSVPSSAPHHAGQTARRPEASFPLLTNPPQLTA